MAVVEGLEKDRTCEMKGKQSKQSLLDCKEIKRTERCFTKNVNEVASLRL